MTCPYCGSNVLKAQGGVVNPHVPGLVAECYWVCSRYPECDTYVGCHPGTDDPVGTIADLGLREWRRKAHAAFDPMWQGGAMTLAGAHSWMRVSLKVDKKTCSVGLLDVNQCKRLVQFCERKAAK